MINVTTFHKHWITAYNIGVYGLHFVVEMPLRQLQPVIKHLIMLLVGYSTL